MSWWAWLEQEWYGLSVLRWSIASALLVGIFFLRRLIAKGFSRLLYSFAFRRQTHITLQELETLMQPAWIFLLAITTFYTSARIVRFLHLPSTSQEIIQRVFEGLALLAGGLIGSRLLAVFETILQHRFNESGETYKSQLIHPLFTVAYCAVFDCDSFDFAAHTSAQCRGSFYGFGVRGVSGCPGGSGDAPALYWGDGYFYGPTFSDWGSDPAGERHYGHRRKSGFALYPNPNL
jgi:hypothetical protein